MFVKTLIGFSVIFVGFTVSVTYFRVTRVAANYLMILGFDSTQSTAFAVLAPIAGIFLSYYVGKVLFRVIDAEGV